MLGLISQTILRLSVVRRRSRRKVKSRREKGRGIKAQGGRGKKEE